MPAILVLEITSGAMKRSRYCVEDGEQLVVGRGQTSGCYIIDPRLSREHFVIAKCNQQWTIRDLDSANGTIVNGDQIKVCTLKDNDCIQAGDTLFRCILKGTAAPLLNTPNLIQNSSDSDYHTE